MSCHRTDVIGSVMEEVIPNLVEVDTKDDMEEEDIDEEEDTDDILEPESGSTLESPTGAPVRLLSLEQKVRVSLF